jgi:hypothetical protein
MYTCGWLPFLGIVRQKIIDANIFWGMRTLVFCGSGTITKSLHSGNQQFFRGLGIFNISFIV